MSKFKSLFLLTWTIFVISWMSITPFPSTSYILNAHFNFSSGVPLDVTSMANRNSCKETWEHGKSSLLSSATGKRGSEVSTVRSLPVKLKSTTHDENSIRQEWRWHRVRLLNKCRHKRVGVNTTRKPHMERWTEIAKWATLERNPRRTVNTNHA